MGQVKDEREQVEICCINIEQLQNNLCVVTNICLCGITYFGVSEFLWSPLRLSVHGYAVEGLYEGYCLYACDNFTILLPIKYIAL